MTDTKDLFAEGVEFHRLRCWQIELDSNPLEVLDPCFMTANTRATQQGQLVLACSHKLCV